MPQASHSGAPGEPGSTGHAGTLGPTRDAVRAGGAGKADGDPERTAVPGPRLAARAKHGLGPWWPFMATVAVGLVLLSIGWLHAGGIVMALGFALAAVVRFVRPHDSGGLQVRSRGADVVFYLAAALNVLGAVLLVERLLPLRVVVLADVALLLIVAGVWWRGERDRRRVRP